MQHVAHRHSDDVAQLNRRIRDLEKALRELHRTVNASVLARADDGLLEALILARRVIAEGRSND